MSIRTTSYSEVQSYLTCERRHYYGYGLEIQGKTSSDAMELGTIIHAALAVYYNGRKEGINHPTSTTLAYQCLNELISKAAVWDNAALATKAIKILSEYFAFYGDEDMQVLAVETEYLIPITDDFSLQVRIDLIRRQNGKVIVSDHKVIGNFYSTKKIGIAAQLPLYLAGLRTEGFKVDELEYNMLRSHPNAQERFMRTPVPLSNARVLRTLEEHLRASNRIATLKAKGLEEWSKVVLRNEGACDRCPFNLICEADLNGEETRGLIEYEYRHKEKRA